MCGKYRGQFQTESQDEDDKNKSSGKLKEKKKREKLKASKVATTHICDACLNGLDSPLQQSLCKIICLLVQIL